MNNKTRNRDGRLIGRPDDLDENPGIGQSKGLFARAGSKDAELIAGENTVEGDVENDAALGQGADTGEVGRENG